MKPLALLVAFLVCSFTLTLPAELPRRPVKPPVGVPEDAKLFNGKWYKVILEHVEWSTAERECRSKGGQLAVVPDAATNAFIATLNPTLMLWLGATDEKVEGLWVWVDGKEMKFRSFAKGQPSGGRKENCLARGRDNAHLWYDLPNRSDLVVGYICEWPAK